MSQTVARHKTAISRVDLSRPLKLAMSDGLLNSESRLFDYGCGKGDDLRYLSGIGVEGSGWDPVHLSEGELKPSPIVNLGYVLNVIEDPKERQEVLSQAWSLTEKLLIVSARHTSEMHQVRQGTPFNDGFITGFGTFQKFYEQDELRNLIDQTLQTSSISAALGVLYVFRNEEDRSTYIASRYRRRIYTPRLSRPEQLFYKHQDLLQPLIDFAYQRGRIPYEDELVNAAELIQALGSLKRAFRLIIRIADESDWANVSKDRANELLIFLALSRFEGRLSLSKLPRDIQLDIKSFFSSYKRASEEAEKLLFSVGEPAVREKALRKSEVGKLTPNALYVHTSAIEYLSPVLRLFEACAQIFVGRIEGANLIKLHRDAPKVSYLAYPDFETDAHPALYASCTVDFLKFKAKFRDYSGQANPPILHRKETFIHPEHQLYAKFYKLTKAEEAKGLYEQTNSIGTREGWFRVLEQKGLTIKGHRLLKANKAWG
jgi:DNA phosphorothioation-associated putative methyltransferase